MSNWELLVINDGSTDGSDALIRNYSDPRIRYFEQVNSGAASAILRGYNESTGEFIAFLDQDDIWLSDFLEMHHVGSKTERIFLLADGALGSRTRRSFCSTSDLIVVDLNSCSIGCRHRDSMKLSRQ